MELKGPYISDEFITNHFVCMSLKSHREQKFISLLTKYFKQNKRLFSYNT